MKMKHTTSLLIVLSIVYASVARAGDTKVEAIMAMERDGDPVTTFDASVPKIYALFKTEGVEAGEKLRSVWIADDVGDAAPANTKIDEKTLNAEGDTEDGVFSLSRERSVTLQDRGSV
jgi:hypothetical protein